MRTDLTGGFGVRKRPLKYDCCLQPRAATRIVKILSKHA